MHHGSHNKGRCFWRNLENVNDCGCCSCEENTRILLKKQIISLMTSLWHLRVRRISADELHTLTVDPEEDGGPVDMVQYLLQPNLSAWSTSSCGLSVSAPNKLNLISKSVPLISPEWTVNRTSIIYTDPSVSSCVCCSGAALQLLQQCLDACLRHQNWEERNSFDVERAREKERWIKLA